MSYGRRLGAGILGALLGWLAMIAVAALIHPAFLLFLVAWPIYGIVFVLAGLIASLVAAAFPSPSRRRPLLLAAALTVLLFALLPAWFFWLSQSRGQF